MWKIVTLALALYLLVALFTRGRRRGGKPGTVGEQADRAVLVLATTTRYVLIAILVFVVAATGVMLFGGL